jgi:hypothetical protein
MVLRQPHKEQYQSVPRIAEPQPLWTRDDPRQRTGAEGESDATAWKSRKRDEGLEKISRQPSEGVLAVIFPRPESPTKPLT